MTEIETVGFDITDISYLYNEFHALIDHHGNSVCRAKPQCGQCVIRRLDKTIFCYHGWGKLKKINSV